MDDNVLRMQQAAERRVHRMQEHSRQLLKNGPTFGAGLLTPPTPSPTAAPDKHKREPGDGWLLLLLILLVSQNGGNRTLLMVLLYLAL